MAMLHLPVIAVTSGEPAGIGPELCAALAVRHWVARLVVIGDIQLLQERAACMEGRVHFEAFEPGAKPGPGVIEVIHEPLTCASKPGQLDKRNAGYVLRLLDRAIQGCQTGEFAAMVTAPVQKSVINEAGIAFTGHTEYLAEKTNTLRVVMMLAGAYVNEYSNEDANKHSSTHHQSEPTKHAAKDWLRVALATTHLPLSQVSAAITAENLTTTLQILHADLQCKFGLVQPRILVAGLNPHAGESGHIGREEVDVIIPVLDRLRLEGMNLLGPLPADTLFTPRQLAKGDAVLAMFHDQGLPTLKYVTFGGGINVTLGLPIIRTSVDHGTALDLAGTGRADPGSLYMAVECALDMAVRAKTSTP